MKTLKKFRGEKRIKLNTLFVPFSSSDSATYKKQNVRNEMEIPSIFLILSFHFQLSMND